MKSTNSNRPFLRAGVHPSSKVLVVSSARCWCWEVPFAGGSCWDGSWPPATARCWCLAMALCSSGCIPPLRRAAAQRCGRLPGSPSSEPTWRSALIPSSHGTALLLLAPSLHFYGNCKNLSPFVSFLVFFFVCLCWLCLFCM